MKEVKPNTKSVSNRFFVGKSYSIADVMSFLSAKGCNVIRHDDAYMFEYSNKSGVKYEVDYKDTDVDGEITILSIKVIE